MALLDVYHSAAPLTKNLGVRGLPMLATVRATRVADELDDPAWSGMVAFMRGASSSTAHRPRQYRQSVAAADALRPHLDDHRAVEMYGMLHLIAADACAAQHRAEDTMTHLDEAGALADGLDDEVGTFSNLDFGRTIVGMWRVSLAVELGEGGRVAELARDVHPEVISASRQSTAVGVRTSVRGIRTQSEWLQPPRGSRHGRGERPRAGRRRRPCDRG